MEKKFYKLKQYKREVHNESATNYNYCPLCYLLRNVPGKERKG
nr:MAG TPA: Inner membrane protein YgaP protein [Caudoviricetes sp.]